jgi:hypothetical protein
MGMREESTKMGGKWWSSVSFQHTTDTQFTSWLYHMVVCTVWLFLQNSLFPA